MIEVAAYKRVDKTSTEHAQRFEYTKVPNLSSGPSGFMEKPGGLVLSAKLEYLKKK